MNINSNVAWVCDETESSIALLVLPKTTPLVLRDTAAQIFLDIAAGADPAKRWGWDKRVFEDEAGEFLTQLVSLGVLTGGE